MRHFVLLVITVSAATLALSAGAALADSHGAATGAADTRSLIEKELDKIPSGKAGEQQMLEMMNERLTLTDEQQEQVKPIIAETIASMEQARDRFKSGELTAMALMMQIQMTGKKSAMQIEPLLTEEQVAEYQAMRQEQKQAMAQEMMKRRAAMGGGM